MEISPFLASLLGNIVISIGIIVVILVIKLIKNKLLSYIDYITAITVGLLLGIIFLGFIPKLMQSNIEPLSMGFFILGGIFLFYFLELFLHWHHCKDLDHDNNCHSSSSHKHESGILIFGGTFLHNAFHGIVLFSAFAIDLHFGIATGIAVLLHSIPQNIVNYIMNHNNPKFAYIASIGGVFGALITYPFSEFLIENKIFILAIIVGGLLYTALADIFPEHKGKGSIKSKIVYMFFIFIGILLFLGFENISEHNHEEIHHEEIHHDGEE